MMRGTRLLLLALAGCAGDPVPAQEVAPIGAVCRPSQNTPEAPLCDRTAGPDVACLDSDDGESSFCSPACVAGDHAACQRWFPGGCCTQVPDGVPHCVPQRFCAAPKKTPGETCVGGVECASTFGAPVCVRIGQDTEGFCSFACQRHADCHPAHASGCCIDTQTEVGVACFSVEDSERLGVTGGCPP